MQSLYIDNNATEQVLQINRTEQGPGGVGRLQQIFPSQEGLLWSCEPSVEQVVEWALPSASRNSAKSNFVPKTSF